MAFFLLSFTEVIESWRQSCWRWRIYHISRGGRRGGDFISLRKSWLVTTFQLSLFASEDMIFAISRKNMSQKLSLLLLVFGFIWGLMLLHYTFQQPRHQSSVKLREQILDLSKRYVKALAEENKNTMDVENGASMAGYGKLMWTISSFLLLNLSLFKDSHGKKHKDSHGSLTLLSA